MGERAKVILNEYSAKNLLMRDTLDLDKFYTADLKLFVEVARKEIGRLNNIIKTKDKGIIAFTEDLCEESAKVEKAIEYINENWGHWCSNHCKYATETINILKGSDKE